MRRALPLVFIACLATAATGLSACVMTVGTENVLSLDNGFRVEKRARRDVLNDDMFGDEDQYELWGVNRSGDAVCVEYTPRGSNYAENSWIIMPGQSERLMRGNWRGGNVAARATYNNSCSG